MLCNTSDRQPGFLSSWTVTVLSHCSRRRGRAGKELKAQHQLLAEFLLCGSVML